MVFSSPLGEEYYKDMLLEPSLAANYDFVQCQIRKVKKCPITGLEMQLPKDITKTTLKIKLTSFLKDCITDRNT
ncbi:uncharacterized protein PRCAT00004559001 [Priceomyces carsonii]|uniref:uncharacterized protein n=1 Tax=Priceomyces carsonii TaxID=28549 RepID=UPI002ED83DBB|nr:unnamed protein product [Priceomyces carsonii]